MLVRKNAEAGDGRNTGRHRVKTRISAQLRVNRAGRVRLVGGVGAAPALQLVVDPQAGALLLVPQPSAAPATLPVARRPGGAQFGVALLFRMLGLRHAGRAEHRLPIQRAPSSPWGAALGLDVAARGLARRARRSKGRRPDRSGEPPAATV